MELGQPQPKMQACSDFRLKLHARADGGDRHAEEGGHQENRKKSGECLCVCGALNKLHLDCGPRAGKSSAKRLLRKAGAANLEDGVGWA